MKRLRLAFATIVIACGTATPAAALCILGMGSCYPSGKAALALASEASNAWNEDLRIPRRFELGIRNTSQAGRNRTLAAKAFNGVDVSQYYDRRGRLVPCLATDPAPESLFCRMVARLVRAGIYGKNQYRFGAVGRADTIEPQLTDRGKAVFEKHSKRLSDAEYALRMYDYANVEVLSVRKSTIEGRANMVVRYNAVPTEIARILFENTDRFAEMARGAEAARISQIAITEVNGRWVYSP